jgi:hypothetical protein
MWHVRKRGEVLTEFSWGDLRKGVRLKDLGENWKIVLKCIFKKCDGEVRTGLIWLRIVTGGGLL